MRSLLIAHRVPPLRWLAIRVGASLRCSGFISVYNPQSGRICVDNRDVRDVTIESPRKYIGVVPQAPVRFHDTVMYNLRYANLNATDEEIQNACRAAHLHDSIMAFRRVTIKVLESVGHMLEVARSSVLQSLASR